MDPLLLMDPLLCRCLKIVSASFHACASHRGAVCAHSDLSRCVVYGCGKKGMHVEMLHLYMLYLYFCQGEVLYCTLGCCF